MATRIRSLEPLAPGPSAVRRGGALLRALLSARRGSRASEGDRAELEHVLMRLLAGGGLGSVERVVRELTRRGKPLARTEDGRGLRVWHAGTEGNAKLRIAVTNVGGVRTTSVMWQAPAAKPTRRERVRHPLQEEFYSRYLAAGQRAYDTPPRAISSADRLILLIGELEADVHNGGFGQYLENKGRRRARSTLVALRTAGAVRTAELLATALDGNPTERELSRLDDRFAKGREDLAVLAMRCLG